MPLFTSIHHRREKLLNSLRCTRCAGEMTQATRPVQWVPPLLLLAGLGLMAVSIPVGALTMVAALAVPERQGVCKACKDASARPKTQNL